MLKAASIFLRSDFNRQDLEHVMDWLSNDHITQYLHEFPDTPTEIEELIERVPSYLWPYHLNRDGKFFLICREPEDSIGFVKCVGPANGAYEIVFAIGEERLWGNGYGAAAISRTVSHLFFEQRATAVIAKIYHKNERSKRAITRCGFSQMQSGSRLSTYQLTMQEYLKRLQG